MDRLKVYCRGECCGEATLSGDEVRVEIRLFMDDPGDGLYRAALRGERGTLALGVLEPQDGRLALCRRPYCRDVKNLGTLERVEATCSFPFRKKQLWRETACPAELFGGEALRKRLEGFSRAWWRRGQDRLELALPLEDGRPFPLEMLFCLARVGVIEGHQCVVFGFDGQETPVL